MLYDQSLGYINHILQNTWPLELIEEGLLSWLIILLVAEACMGCPKIVKLLKYP